MPASPELNRFLSRAIAPSGSAILFGTQYGGCAFDLVTGKPCGMTWPFTDWYTYFRFGPDFIERYADNLSYGAIKVATPSSETGVSALSVVQIYSNVVMAGSNSNGGVRISTGAGTSLQPRLAQWPNTNRLGWTKYSSPNWDDTATVAPQRTTSGLHAAAHAIGISAGDIATYASDGVRSAASSVLNILTGFEPRPRSSVNTYFDQDGVAYAAYRLHAVVIAPFYASGDQLAEVTRNPRALLRALQERAMARVPSRIQTAWPLARYSSATISITARKVFGFVPRLNPRLPIIR